MGRFDLLVSGSTTLKEKRRVVQSLLTRLRNKFNVAVAEVDHQDLQRRGAFGVACVSSSAFHAGKMLEEIERFVRAQYEVEVLSFDSEVMVPDA
ncbi:MAG: DUF503 domain-containing protein [Actinomycetota bacterium]